MVFKLPESFSLLNTGMEGRWIRVMGCRNNSHFFPDFVYSSNVVFMTQFKVCSACFLGMLCNFFSTNAMFASSLMRTYVSSWVHTQLQYSLSTGKLFIDNSTSNWM